MIKFLKLIGDFQEGKTRSSPFADASVSRLAVKKSGCKNFSLKGEKMLNYDWIFTLGGRVKKLPVSFCLFDILHERESSQKKMEQVLNSVDTAQVSETIPDKGFMKAAIKKYWTACINAAEHYETGCGGWDDAARDATSRAIQFVDWMFPHK